MLISSGIKDQIINAYKFETPAVIFILPSKETAKIEQFVRELDEFFYAGATSFKDKSNKSTLSKLILLSRFKNLFEVAFHYYSYKWNPKLDNLADLSHILSGKPLLDQVITEGVEVRLLNKEEYISRLKEKVRKGYRMFLFDPLKPTTIEEIEANKDAIWDYP